MNDPVRAARDDLAFMKELAEDRGPVPGEFGAQIFWPGLLYGLNVIFAWAEEAGIAPSTRDWVGSGWGWAPATVIYIPICLWFVVRSMGRSWGPGARMFSAAWSGVGLMTLTIVTAVSTASYKMGVNYVVVWPSIAMAIYGSAWLILGILRRRLWHVLVAVGCCITSVAMGFLVEQKEQWLVMGIGLLLFMALPGFLMMKPHLMRSKTTA